ncbi:ABC-2 transporter permease [Archaeoglobus neptunius]|uniref:ABC transporter permease subunit n=1 Tax=Archaeoglobus neptunius TaxID=2798580 RepID=UPI001927947C|nr:ABC transporter permease subunit [Archaeoglobus neptunius]
MMGVIFRKELWTLRENPSYLYSHIIPPLILVLLLTAVVLTNGVVLTPQSRAIAINQIKSSPQFFGLSHTDVDGLGDAAISMAVLIAQIPIVIQIFAYITTYNAVVQSFMTERVNKTMEVLFSTPLRDEDIIYGKILFCMCIAGATVALSGAVNTAAIEILYWMNTSRLWTPTSGYLTMITVLPLSMMLLALPLALLISVRAKSSQATKWGSLAGLLPIALFVVGLSHSPAIFFMAVELLGGFAFVVSLLLTVALKRTINRLSFIVN